MTLLERGLTALQALEQRQESIPEPLRSTDARAKLCVTALYLSTLLSTPLTRPLQIVSFALYPVLLSAIAGISHMEMLKPSLMVLPFVLAIAIFNPFYDREPILHIGTLVVSRGEMTFFTLPLRAVLAAEGLILLIFTTPTRAICRALRQAGIPPLFATQLLILQRYAGVVLQEAVAMQQARTARGFGRRSYPIRFCASTVTELLMRCIARAERIRMAMAARGFNGTMPEIAGQGQWRRSDTLYLLTWGALFLALRMQPFIR